MDFLANADPDTLVFAIAGLAVSAVVYLKFVRAPPPPPVMYGVTSAGGAGAGADDDDDDDDSKYPGGAMSVYFASQTGTAENFAKTLAGEAKRFGWKAKVIDLEDFDPEQLKSTPIAVFMAATYGEGEPPDNAIAFNSWLANKEGELDATSLAGVQFMVFALFNSQYEHKAAFGRLIDAKLETFGASRLYERGEGDDDGTLDEDFEAWREAMWPELRAQLLPDGGADVGEAGPQEPALEWRAQTVPEPAAGNRPRAASESHVAPSTKHYFSSTQATVAVSRELRQSTAAGSTKHIELDLVESGLEYEIADNLAVLPHNSEVSVARFAAAAGLDLDQWFVLEPRAGSPKQVIPTPCSVRRLLSEFCEIEATPKKPHLAALAFYASAEADVQQLVHLMSHDGKDEYHALSEQQTTWYELLERFPSTRLPVEAIVELVPRLVPRYYTISSTPTVHPARVHVTVAELTETKKGGSGDRQHLGVCSHHMCRLPEGRPMTVFIRASSFRLPLDPSRPVVMIGPGTGLAPMRAFCQERQAQRRANRDVGPTVLYFGCRRRDEDFIYEDEIMEWARDGTLTALHLAFSREQADKIYVQDRLRETADEFWDLIHEQGGSVYVCGGTAMGNDIHHATVEIATRKLGCSAFQAEEIVKQWQQDGRYVQELWA